MLNTVKRAVLHKFTYKLKVPHKIKICFPYFKNCMQTQRAKVTLKNKLSSVPRPTNKVIVIKTVIYRCKNKMNKAKNSEMVSYINCLLRKKKKQQCSVVNKNRPFRTAWSVTWTLSPGGFQF